MPSSDAPPIAVPAALAFIAGFADASTFVGADGIFCAHVTGNFVVLAAELARGASADEWLKLASFPVFICAVLTATYLFRRRGPRPSAHVLLAIEAAALGAAAIAGLALRGAPARIAVVVLTVIAMGTQNAMHRVTPSLGPMTTVMTGNVTQWLVGKVKAKRAEPDALGHVIAAFAAGCFAGGFGAQRLGFGALLLPMLLALGLMVRLKPSQK